MDCSNASERTQTVWQVSRLYTGEREPEALLLTLILAHDS